MYIRNLSLITLLAVLSGVKAQKEEWLCNCTMKAVYDPVITKQCCAQAGGNLVAPPPPQCDLFGSPLVGPAQNFIDCCVKFGDGFCCVPANGTAT
ncbi:hypothetical protein C8F04DRAFT_1093128 [Mycena alexandri]|uniref:Uncharacterized protein n=1 Tax=Mycena alexandri TaxID=1745969 RepID=A0AAD6WSV2_9AGAR|nr:hypothetical protein C8F04DRAFT_1401540 [Mycena alexandri]KAJ7023690.1 hypothetical protein C8F04DRAFT_1133667 [Mycena alexandri]KAJ7037279.1 hypothetical protein C8F04DRAFT_1093128 [Mycena alexandri]